MFALSKTLRAKAAATVSFNVDLDVWDYSFGRFVLLLDSDAGTGTTPTLDAKVQTTPDGGTTWFDLPSTSFTQVTGGGASKQALKIENAGTRIRVAVTIGGTTPSFNVGIYAVGQSGC